jgi:predicted N-formylglutamate amidohydrolase
VPQKLRGELVARYYTPYRNAVRASIAAAIRRGRRVVHLSCHSFVPRLAGVRRTADIGLLYDPRRTPERRLCLQWKSDLERQTRLAVKLNYPYRGTGDGFTTDLRKRWSAGDYLGIELEVNQRFARAGALRWRRVRRLLVATFAQALRGSL